jgi:hypothetical protein
MGILKYKRELIIGLKIVVPIIGILFLDWSIGMVFLYFFLDLLFVAGETILKIFVSLKSSIGSRIGIFVRFVLLFAMMFIFILVAAGHFFDGGSDNMKATFDMEIIYSLALVYAVEFLVGFIFSGDFKTTTANEVEKKTYYLLGLIFMVMLLFLFLLNSFAKPDQVNYVLGISLILAREAADYLVGRGVAKTL